MKEVFDNRDASRRVSEISFGLFGAPDTVKLSHVQCINRELYWPQTREPFPHGVLDQRLGTSDKQKTCSTCKLRMAECVGHWGFVKLELPVYHPGYFRAVLGILSCICKTCSRILLDDTKRSLYLARYRRANLENLQRKMLAKQIMVLCRRTTNCPHCGSYNGSIKKVGMMKIIHEKWKRKANSQDSDLLEFRRGLENVAKEKPEIQGFISKAQEALTPLRVLEMFKRVTDEDCEILDLNVEFGRPERLICTHILVPPVCIRPSVAMEGGAGSNEDDITMKISEIIFINTIIRKHMETGANVTLIMEDWDFLHLQCAMLVNSEITGVPYQFQATKPSRGLCQRLKGKSGRFRGNLSGKRVDFSSRTVISPDPNLKINQVAVPQDVAKILTYPERVTKFNIDRLRKLIRNGPDKYPGANFIELPDKSKRFLKYVDRPRMADELSVGAIVERHLCDDDIVLFNRQPSLHKMSIMAHRVTVRPHKTFRLNECVCTPYNADFDGDEMNLHVPQSETARVEAQVLMGINNNTCTPRDGAPLIAAIQDFITASYLLTQKDVFMDRAQFMQLCSYLSDGELKITMPPPCIWKPVRMWSGKQVFSMLLSYSDTARGKVNIEAATKGYSKSGESLCAKDGYVVIRNGELLAGAIDKSVIGSGSKKTIFYHLLHDYGPEVSADRMSRLSKLCTRFLSNYGFSIGIGDVQPGETLTDLKEVLVKRGYEKCNEYISEFREGRLTPQAGYSAEETLEAVLNGELSAIREDAGKICLQELSPFNSPMIMALCGSKGSNINISQMIACVGQQTVSGSRVPEGFEDRTLPHFTLRAKEPAAKGFVRNSFYTGLTPTEFFFHTMGGREGLVDTAVKTAETGYMQRRLMKALEDLCVSYDHSVRNSTGHIIQFTYGDDSYDPTLMQGDESVIQIDRLFKHIMQQHLEAEQRQRSPTITDPKQLLKYKSILKEKIVGTGIEHDGEQIKLVNRQIDGLIERLASLRRKFSLESGHSLPKRQLDRMQNAVKHVFPITEGMLEEFIDVIVERLTRSKVQPGEAVGALAAQSIGEPGTQMTLKTFHFAGVASMNITLGVPRIKEIINATRAISTPIMTVALERDDDVKFARQVKGRLERTYLSEISKYIEEVLTPDRIYVKIKLDQERIALLKLEINAEAIVNAILTTKRLKLKPGEIDIIARDEIRIYPGTAGIISLDMSLQLLRQYLDQVIVQGLPSVNRAVINDTGTGRYNLLVEGTDLQRVLATPGVIANKTVTNHIIEAEKFLGIEAARTTIMNEINYTMKSHGMNVNPRHIMLLADLMTFKGEILGITRFGISKMKDSVLMLASFEKTTDHLFEAALHGKSDKIDGVSECIIMGSHIRIGTGIMDILYDTETTAATPPRRTPLLGSSEFRLPLFVN
eukprot:Clim_evm19s234 gene=Clim_evmTU19s234